MPISRVELGRRLRRIKLHHRQADLYQWLTSLFVEWYYSCYVLCHSYFVKWAGRSFRSAGRSPASSFHVPVLLTPRFMRMCIFWAVSASPVDAVAQLPCGAAKNQAVTRAESMQSGRREFPLHYGDAVLRPATAGEPF